MFKAFETEIMITKNRFTENEILLLNYFKEKLNNYLNDDSIYEQNSHSYGDSEDLIEIKNYDFLYGNFNYNNTIDLLVNHV